MSTRRMWAAVAVFLLVGVAAVACNERPDERAALEEEELDRELDLALRGDTDSATFEDTAEPEADPEPPPARQPETRPQPEQPREQAPPPAPVEPEPEPEPEPEVRMVSIPAGTTFAVRLNETLSTGESQPGQEFTASLTDPIVAMDSRVVIPSGATVRGRVTAVEPSGRVGETALIKLAFEALSFAGQSYPLQATVVEANPERRTRQSVGQQAAKIGAGAAAGAVLGRIIGGDTRDAVKGAVAGAAAGTAIAMGTADVDAVLPSGSRMVVRTDAPIEVEQVATR